MEDLVKDIENKLNGKPFNFLKTVSKNIFYNYLQEYREAVKYIPTYILKDKDTTDDSDKSDQDTRNGKDNANTSSYIAKTPRILKIEELQTKIQSLKGKSLNEVGTLKRKGLRNRLKKKLKKEERLKTKIEKKDEINVKECENKIILPQTKVENNGDVNENEVVYSKFDFPEDGDDTKRKKGPRDPMRILQKVQKNKKKLHAMEARGRNDKVNEIKRITAWETAIEKAEGQKVKDDVELLKKSIRKKKNAKNRSQKKWEERKQTIEQKKQDAQKKRKTNIQNKKKEKQKNKLKKLIKKGRVIP